MSSAWSERPGAWRIVTAGAVLLVAGLPAVPLLVASATPTIGQTWSASFLSALASSFTIGGLVAAGALAIGWPVGVLAAIYECPGRRLLISLVSLPLVVPSFLWALGWSALAARLGPAATELLSGRSGAAVVFLSAAIPLVLLASYISVASLAASQVEAARLAGGERTAFRCACRHAAPTALLASALAAVLTLSDPGPGQIVGVRTAASEILTSFAAQFDFALAARQCLLLAAAVLLVAGPLAVLAAPRLSVQLLARQAARRVEPRRQPMPSAMLMVALGALTFLVTVLPILGILWPLLRERALSRAWQEVERTALSTLIFAVGAAAIATCLAFVLAAAVGRVRWLLIVSVGTCLVLFALPPALGALGIAAVATHCPPALDPLLRSRLIVAGQLGLRFVPVAALLAHRAWGTMPTSWSQAAAIHGVPRLQYLIRVIVPYMSRSLLFGGIAVALLATADVTTVLVLHPPGQASLPLAIFTVMANAPESLVASLCAIHLALAGALLCALRFSVRWA